jgi:MoaA/NifB/PqqE/SkfB family radical SAM enzyme
MYKLKTIKRGLAALTNPAAPVLAQVVVTRRCNLSCGYCTEYDHVSSPVETSRLINYIDHLANLGTCVITFTGGEPLLHPDLDRLIGHVVAHNMACTSISNGFLLTSEWVDRLNRSGLELLQISVDNLEPNGSSQKTFRVLKQRLRVLEAARFKININAVLGSTTPAETRQLAREIRALGFYMTVGLMHGDDGMLDSGLLGTEDLETLYRDLQVYRRRSLSHWFGEGWEYEMIRNGHSNWKCRAGARYLYVDEDGIVSYCSQRRGQPGIPILEYGHSETKRLSSERKGCEEQCTLACVRRASALDRFRHQEEKTRPQPSKIPLPVVASHSSG